MNGISRKLKLNRETIRVLQDSELSQVVGGVRGLTGAIYKVKCPPYELGESASICPVPNGIALEAGVQAGGYAKAGFMVFGVGEVELDFGMRV